LRQQQLVVPWPNVCFSVSSVVDRKTFVTTNEVTAELSVEQLCWCPARFHYQAAVFAAPTYFIADPVKIERTFCTKKSICKYIMFTTGGRIRVCVLVRQIFRYNKLVFCVAMMEKHPPVSDFPLSREASELVLKRSFPQDEDHFYDDYQGEVEDSIEYTPGEDPDDRGKRLAQDLNKYFPLSREASELSLTSLPHYEDDSDDDYEEEVEESIGYNPGKDPDDSGKKLAQDLNQLSLKEREDILHEIHGVSDAVEEEPDFVAHTLLELDMWIGKQKKNTIAEAYKMAETLSPSYVQARKFRLMFLRADRFDAKDAATRMFRHFEQKLELFGASKLCKDITLEDMGPEDLECLHNGHLTLLPIRDQAGRVINATHACMMKYANYENAVR
jgi:hypothetical protein